MFQASKFTLCLIPLLVAPLLVGCLDEHSELDDDALIDELDAELDIDAPAPEPWDDGADEDDILPILPDVPEGCVLPRDPLVYAAPELDPEQVPALTPAPKPGIEAPAIALEPNDDDDDNGDDGDDDGDDEDACDPQG